MEKKMDNYTKKWGRHEQEQEDTKLNKKIMNAMQVKEWGRNQEIRWNKEMRRNWGESGDHEWKVGELARTRTMSELSDSENWAEAAFES